MFHSSTPTSSTFLHQKTRTSQHPNPNPLPGQTRPVTPVVHRQNYHEKNIKLRNKTPRCHHLTQHSTWKQQIPEDITSQTYFNTTEPTKTQSNCQTTDHPRNSSPYMLPKVWPGVNAYSLMVWEPRAILVNKSMPDHVMPVLLEHILVCRSHHTSTIKKFSMNPSIPSTVLTVASQLGINTNNHANQFTYPCRLTSDSMITTCAK